MTSMPTTLPPIVIGAVLAAGVLHATWNAIASSIDDEAVTFTLIGATETVVAAVILGITGLPSDRALPFAVGSAVIHVAYNFSLLRFYRLGNFGHTYPLARGTSPLLVALGAWALAGESLDPAQVAGLLAVAVGLMSIVFASGRLKRADVPATIVATITGVTIAGYTIVDGLGVRHAGDPVAYLALLFVLQGPLVAVAGAVLLRNREPRLLARRQIRAAPRGVLAGALSMAAYGIVIWAQTRGPLALVSALRETSVISAALIATLLFREPFGRRRVAPAVVVATGIVLIAGSR